VAPPESGYSSNDRVQVPGPSDSIPVLKLRIRFVVETAARACLSDRSGARSVQTLGLVALSAWS
jgi:hypothetical protein